MSPHLLKPALSRWEVRVPLIDAVEKNSEFGPIFNVLHELSVLREIAPSGSIDCTDCGELCHVAYISDQAGIPRGFIHCRDCGIAPVPDERLKRWEVHSAAFLEAIFSEIRIDIQERVAGQLWQVGKATWGDRSREVWFARAFRPNASGDALKVLEGRPKAILFAPTEAGAERWRDATANLVIALESALIMVEDAIQLDMDYVEGRIVDAGMGPGARSQPRTKMRASRAANIESLKQEMIKHLRAARDHAYETKKRTGEPVLLPRPSRKNLGTITDLKNYQVTKCFQDSEARELNLYWEIAADLDQIMRWKGPVKRGRAS